MKENVDKRASQVKEFFAKMERKNRIRLIMGAAVIIVLAIVIAFLLSRTTYTILYTGLAPGDAGNIYNELESRNEKVKMDGAGTIMVPEDRKDILQAQLVADGVVSDDVNLDIVDKGSGFGATDSEKQYFEKIQLQHDMRKWINNYEKVEDCVVTLNQTKEQAYAIIAKQEEPTAAVIITLSGPEPLTDLEADTIRQYIAAGAGIKRENISISDNTMRPYPLYSGEDEEDIPSSAEQLMLKEQYENHANESIKNLLYPLVGHNVTASTSVVLNFDKIVEEAREFFPVVDDSEGIVASARKVYESWRGDEYAEGIPGTDTNGIGTAEYPWNNDLTDTYYQRYVDETNYEITEILTQTEKARGHVTDVTLAVVVDGEVVDQESAEALVELCANAVGIKDMSKVTVMAAPFTNVAETVADITAREDELVRLLKRQELVKTAIIWVVIAAIVLMVLLFLRYFFKAREDEELAQVILADGTGLNVDYITGGDEPPDMEDDFDINQKTESIVQLERFIDKDPEAVASLLRNWLSEEGM